MYTAVLTLHSLIRWAVLVLGALALVRAVLGVAQRRDWTGADDRAGLLYTIALDVQMLVGLALYFGLSPVTSAALKDMGAAMSVPSLRFWAVEHTTLMVAALVLAHIGRVRVRKARDARSRHRGALIFFLLSLLAALAGIPWPGTANGRPLLRLG
jgi:hypothetical protein